MWFEARKQERKLRSVMVNHKRRVERRSQFYERIRREPAEFLQVHGRKCKIYVDPSVARQAESANTLRPWQGDANILIDRFDARSMLDSVSDYKATHDDDLSDEERQRNYERYRVLIGNEFEKVPEERFLKQIYMEEHHGRPAGSSSLVKLEEEKKKYLSEQKAAIGFSYDGADRGANGGRRPRPPSESSSDESEDEEDYDMTLDATKLTADDHRELSRLSAKYKLQQSEFVSMLKADREEQEQMKQLKHLEEARAALSGKQSRRERQLLKEQRLLLVGGKGVDGSGATTTLLSFIKKETPKPKLSTSSGSSESDSSSPAKPVQYISSFGAEPESDTEKAAPVQGPAPPPGGYERLAELRNRKSSSPEFGHANRRERSPSRKYRKRSRSRSRETRRDRSRDTRRHRSRSRDRDRRQHYRRSSSRSRRDRRSHSHSKSRNGNRRSVESRSSRRSHRSSRSSGSPKRQKPKTTPPTVSKAKEPSPPKVSEMSPKFEKEDSYKSGYSSDESSRSQMSIRSSMSDSEQERRQVENRRRRIKRAKKEIRDKSTSSQTRESSKASESDKSKSRSVRDKLKLQTQRALKKTLAKDKEEEMNKKTEVIKEQIEREEEMREISSFRRKKEREERHKAREEYDRLVGDERRKRKHSSHSDDSGSSGS